MLVDCGANLVFLLQTKTQAQLDGKSENKKRFVITFEDVIRREGEPVNLQWQAKVQSRKMVLHVLCDLAIGDSAEWSLYQHQNAAERWRQTVKQMVNSNMDHTAPIAALGFYFRFFLTYLYTVSKTLDDCTSKKYWLKVLLTLIFCSIFHGGFLFITIILILA